MQLSPEQAIGIFDSGVGGLTVAAAIRNLLPAERMIYFGDTAHLPYGDKSADAIRYYSVKITEFLLEMGCKLILVACNTASASAFDALKEKFEDRVLLLNVIDPVINYLAEMKDPGIVGVIGTKGTINSGTYEKKLRERKPEIRTVSMPTPLLVPMIEEGFIYDDISNAIIRAYLSDERIKDIHTLVLGCTHYPIIKNQISKYYNFGVEIIDSSRIMAAELGEKLESHGLLARKREKDHEFYVSDYTEYFRKISGMFFEENIGLKLKDLWR